ncbi:putative trans-2-enoyl-CoA reductase, mitochondrial [Leucoagaricus sp. SymC.cos]|nr:putative trans-2-enoyl-CoA reductase, mitochondrial [Leucoagaricus sp. SymC.cos]
MVTSVGENTTGLQVGDWVVMVKQQAGTWSTNHNVKVNDVVKIPDHEGLSEVHVATITVNPPTAYNMLTDYVELNAGDWVMQNGANSAVGQAVIQIAAARGLKTLNFVRSRDDIEHLKEQLCGLGATQVLTYEDLNDKSLRDKVKGWLGGKEIHLALNCVGGKETTAMLRYIGKDGHLVSYGAMSKQPFSLPTSAFIFKNLTAHGFWQSRWYLDHSAAEREALMGSLTQLMKKGKFQAPEHEIVSIGKQESDSEATSKIRGIFQKLAAGRYGKKVLLKFEE